MIFLKKYKCIDLNKHELFRYDCSYINEKYLTRGKYDAFALILAPIKNNNCF